MGKISDALEKSSLDKEKSIDIQSESLQIEQDQQEKPQRERGAEEKLEPQEVVSQKEEEQDRWPEKPEVSSSPSKSSTPQVAPDPLGFVEVEDSAGIENWDQRLYKAVKEDEYLPELFKTLRSRILVPVDGQQVPKTIMVTSAEPNEGKSFITANLGVSIAQGVDQHCLLVSCDLRRPSLSTLFGLNNSCGLVDYLRDKKDLSTLIQKTAVDKLSIIASGKPPANPAELLGSSRMKGLVEELSKRYEDRIVIFDTPPYQLAAESAILAKLVDSIILVVRQDGSSRHQVKKLLEKMKQERLLGIVFNDHTTNLIERSLMKAYSGYTPQDYH